MSRPDPIQYAERLYAAIRAANFSPISFLAFGNAVKDGVDAATHAPHRRRAVHARRRRDARPRGGCCAGRRHRGRGGDVRSVRTSAHRSRGTDPVGSVRERRDGKRPARSNHVATRANFRTISFPALSHSPLDSRSLREPVR